MRYLARVAREAREKERVAGDATRYALDYCHFGAAPRTNNRRCLQFHCVYEHQFNWICGLQRNAPTHVSTGLARSAYSEIFKA